MTTIVVSYIPSPKWQSRIDNPEAQVTLVYSVKHNYLIELTDAQRFM
jgi:hypothetical protein